ncbi:alpha/beta fold hydrolase [Candidatus Omnitrophota bacterium]
MPYIKSARGINWFYHQEGTGEPLVFIHGWAGDSSFWKNQVDFFKQDFSVVVFDLPGHGRSEWKDVDLKGIAQDIQSILSELHITQATIIGSSFGGLIALQLFDSFPNLVKRLILVGTNAKFAKSKGYNFGLSRQQIKYFDGLLGTAFPGILDVFFRSLFSEEERTSDGFARVWDAIKGREHMPQKNALKQLLTVLEKEDLRDSLGKIAVPSLLINGEKDYIASPGAGHYLQERIKESRIEIVDKCGHIPFLTQPDSFNRLVKEFIAHGTD